MLKTFFSECGRYAKYAAVVAGAISMYLVTGFILAKKFFEAEILLPTPTFLALLLVGACVFALIHISSMRKLDSTSRTKTKS
ncbi:MAG: hypothetical protein KUG59_05600 [Parvibaculaceae bacterium]|nr:hypothetical protein [Parvibaculaceae bacterium]